MNYSDILIDSPWVSSYLQTFFHDKLVLEYPDSVVFVAQLLNQRLNELIPIYEEYPYAEQFDVSELNSVDWYNENIVFDTNFQMVKAPEPIWQLENLCKRLKYLDAKSFIFGVNPCLSLFSLNLLTIILLTISVFLIDFMWFK
jgi:hypothetical protein